MLEHLIDLEPPVRSVEDAAPALFEHLDPSDMLDAQVKTADLIALFDDEDADAQVLDEATSAAAREAFLTMTNGISPETVKGRLSQLKAPRAVRHLVGMLTAFDWDFVEQARNLRGYAVAQILEETKHPEAKIRLKALEMLGKITEVSLFTTKVDMVLKHETEEDVETRLKERLVKYLTPAPAAGVVVRELPPGEAPAVDAIELELDEAQIQRSVRGQQNHAADVKETPRT